MPSTARGRPNGGVCDSSLRSSACIDLLQEVLASMRVALGTSDTKFSAALGPERCVSVTGEVKAGAPYLTQIGSFDVELAMEGIILLARARPPRSHSTAWA